MRIRNALALTLICGAAVSMTSCSGNKNTTSGDSQAQTDTVVTEQKSEPAIDTVAISNEAIAYLTDVYTRIPTDGKEFSPEFNELIGSAEMTSFKMGDEMGYFDYDVLTQSQDPGSLESVEIASVTPDTVVANVKGGFGDGSVLVTLVRIEGKFKIDDINGEKTKLKEFLER